MVVSWTIGEVLSSKNGNFPQIRVNLNKSIWNHRLANGESCSQLAPCRLHPWKLRWNLKMPTSWRKNIFQTSMFGFHVCFPGCSPLQKLHKTIEASTVTPITFICPVGFYPMVEHRLVIHHLQDFADILSHIAQITFNSVHFTCRKAGGWGL